MCAYVFLCVSAYFYLCLCVGIHWAAMWGCWTGVLFWLGAPLWGYRNTAVYFWAPIAQSMSSEPLGLRDSASSLYRLF